MENKNFFYCYSYRLAYFLKSCGFSYTFKGINANSKSHYYAFKKSLDLDNAIQIWNNLKSNNFKLKEL